MDIRMENYPFETRPLTEDEGGGWMVTFPDLPGCMADGDTLEEAFQDARDAFDAWMKAHTEDGRPIPKPGGKSSGSGRFVLRVPKSLHTRLAARAKQEGVSLNLLAVSMLAESLGAKSAKEKCEARSMK